MCAVRTFLGRFGMSNSALGVACIVSLFGSRTWIPVLVDIWLIVLLDVCIGSP